MRIPIFQASRRRNSRYPVRKRPLRLSSVLKATISSLFLAGLGWIWLSLLSDGHFAIGGIPAPVAIALLENETARKAYFDGDNQTLHAQMQQMDIEAKMKIYLRSQIEDETKLDQHVNQILYDRTGYISSAYQVNSQGILVLKKLEAKN
ncbi:hypothetical protein [Aliterella atlantica]|uniref:hypothetical protein n=1 Tax=Aliterella atlantica TaxID=1827278 RepID=UPI001186103F|nr:hypothetical protein [Aliterella atlantica]